MASIYNNQGKLLFSDNTLDLKQLVEKHKENLKNANLSNCDLSWTDLSWANLEGCNFENSDLSGACLENSFLSGVNLTNANLIKSDLSWAILRNANLTGANLEGANLKGADLTGADFSNCKISDVDLQSCKLPVFSDYNITYILDGSSFETSNFDKVLINIGYETKTIKEWDNFFSNKCQEEYDFKRNTSEFKQIKAHYFSVRTFLEIIIKK
jgi:uncharacterized protein YjbI with pentapeptide repeats